MDWGGLWLPGTSFLHKAGEDWHTVTETQSIQSNGFYETVYLYSKISLETRVFQSFVICSCKRPHAESSFLSSLLALKGCSGSGDAQSPSLHSSGVLSDPEKKHIFTPRFCGNSLAILRHRTTKRPLGIQKTQNSCSSKIQDPWAFQIMLRKKMYWTSSQECWFPVSSLPLFPLGPQTRQLPLSPFSYLNNRQ